MESIKQAIKKIIPLRLMYFFYVMKATRAYMYDISRRVRDKVYHDTAEEKLKRDLALFYHIVEKGLTMPEPRPGFGQAVVQKLIDVVLKYDALHFPKDDVAFKQSVSVLKEYDDFHQEIHYAFNEHLANRLQHIKEQYREVKGLEQIRTSRESYFRDASGPFDRFCRSRYSVRNYTKERIPLPVLYECVELAQRSPSFCNRQPNRVYIVQSEEKKQKILELQNGNRGFGHLADTLIVVTSSVSTTKDIHERNENHLNGGMFCMTLLNALHFHHIGACSLNWSVSNDSDLKIRKLLDVPDHEVVLLVISCGFVPDQFSIAASPRRPADQITVCHSV